MLMLVTFDPQKSERNEAERGISFSMALEFDWNTALVAEDSRRDYGERRFQAVGFIGDAKGTDMPRKANPERVDRDTPELTDEWFAKARPASKVLPGLLGKKNATELLKPKRGRPPVADPKEHVNIRLDADIVLAFKAKGPGWQTRLNSALRQWLRTHAA